MIDDYAIKISKVFWEKVTVSNKAQIASYKVAELIAQKTKPYTVVESLILQTCHEIIIIFGDEASNSIWKILLSDDSILKIFWWYVCEYRRKYK